MGVAAGAHGANSSSHCVETLSPVFVMNFSLLLSKTDRVYFEKWGFQSKFDYAYP